MIQAQINIKPRFEVEPIKSETFSRRIAKHDGKTFSYATKTDKGGYMVYFPQGHSIHVTTDAELKRLGFDRDAPLVDMQSGEEVGTRTSLKERSVRKTKVTKNSQRSGEGAETLDELLDAEGE